MKVKTCFSPAEVEPAEVAGATVAVIDVIRATSTIVQALASGARAIYPTLSGEEAINLANSLGREDALLCGERKGLKIEGFDLGNSPSEFTPERVRGKQLVMSTTNGTRAFLSARGASRVVAASLMNLSAVARSVAAAKSLVVVCAGKENRFSLDDALCAGLLIDRVARERGEPSNASGTDKEVFSGNLDDASRAVLALVGTYEADVRLLKATAAGAALVDVGLAADLDDCAAIDRHDLVPEMVDREIRLP